MKVLLNILACLCLYVSSEAQPVKRVTLPEFTYSYQKPGKYRWEKICEIKGRILFANTIVHDDSVVYSFGGFDTALLQREMNVLTGNRLRREPAIQYPGKGFMHNICFMNDSFLYIGGGDDSSKSKYAERDFWQYNRHTGAWMRLKDLPFYYQHWASTYEYEGRPVVYVPQLSGAGFETIRSAFYSYDEASDTWSMLSSETPDEKLWMPVTFKIGDEVYVLFQHQGSFGRGPLNRFYKFGLATRKWTPLANIPGSPRNFAFAVSDERYGFVGGGSTSGAAYTRNVFRYDPYNDHWEEINKFPRYIRHAIGWRFRGESYVGFGINDEPGTVAIWKLKRR